MTNRAKNNQENRRRRGCLSPLILLILAGIVAFAAYLYLGGFSLVPEREQALAAGQVASSDKLNILLVGSDKNEGLVDGSRADTIIVASVDVEQKTVFLLSLPRDSYVAIPGVGEDKINSSYAEGGIELLRQTVSELLNIPIDYYALIDFAGFEDLIDALGGVEIEVDKRMYYQTYDGLIDIEAGLQTLNGEQALQYVRFRADPLGDITRVSRQQLLLKAIFSKFTESGVTKLPQLLTAVKGSVETDISIAKALRLALLLQTKAPETMESATLDGDFMSLNGISYWRVDEQALQEMVSSRFGDADDD